MARVVFCICPTPRFPAFDSLVNNSRGYMFYSHIESLL